MLIGAANVMIKIDKMRWVSWLICSIVLKVLGLEVMLTKEITIKYAWSITSFTFFDKKLFLRNEIQYSYLKYQSKYIAIISILKITLFRKLFIKKVLKCYISTIHDTVDNNTLILWNYLDEHNVYTLSTVCNAILKTVHIWYWGKMSGINLTSWKQNRITCKNWHYITIFVSHFVNLSSVKILRSRVKERGDTYYFPIILNLQ